MPAATHACQACKFKTIFARWATDTSTAASTTTSSSATVPPLFPRLVSLRLAQVWTPTVLLLEAPFSLHLTSIHMSECLLLAAAHITSICSSCPNLTAIDLKLMDDNEFMWEDETALQLQGMHEMCRLTNFEDVHHTVARNMCPNLRHVRQRLTLAHAAFKQLPCAELPCASLRMHSTLMAVFCFAAVVERLSFASPRKLIVTTAYHSSVLPSSSAPSKPRVMISFVHVMQCSRRPRCCHALASCSICAAFSASR